MYRYERKYWNQGNEYILGLDEVGRGPWAGPLVVAGCILPKYYKNDEINDSKKLSMKKRERLFDEIIKSAIAYDILFISAQDVDKLNPKQASINGMYEVFSSIKPTAQVVLIDAEKVPKIKVKTESIIKGDAKSISIAAASILAKVARDRYMIEIANKYPEYHFDNNKGYGTIEHLKAIQKFGPIKDFHRFSYRPIKEIIKKIAK
ncbi:MAG: ribonuclease HII [Mycoplasma sp.]|nr:ribonuclease HII [Mycoplasma sp.]